MSSRLWAVSTLLGAGLTFACGGQVNLGGKRDNGAVPSDMGVEEPTGPDAPVGKPVAQLPREIQVDLVAVTNDDFLYVGNFFGMSRCRKDDCIPTLELLPTVGSGIMSADVYERSLAVSSGDGESSSFATYSLPTMVQESVVVRDLPGNQTAQLWYGGYVFFTLSEDNNIYRCRLPSCTAGPERVGRFRNDLDLSADGASIFWHDESFVFRSDDTGAVPAVTLLPDESLAVAPEEVKRDPTQALADSIESIATGGGKLYAVVGHPTTAPGCYAGNCSYSIFRWPAAGGKREEVVLVPNGSVDQIFVFGDELVWRLAEGSQAETFVYWSCLASACPDTRRRLGTGARLGQGQVVADSTTLYWLEAGMNPTPSEGAVQFTNRQIRRAPRLDPVK